MDPVTWSDSIFKKYFESFLASLFHKGGSIYCLFGTFFENCENPYDFPLMFLLEIDSFLFGSSIAFKLTLLALWRVYVEFFIMGRFKEVGTTNKDGFIFVMSDID